VGLQYGVSGVLTLGAGLRFTRTDYPNYFPNVGIGNTADGRNIDLTGTWVPNGLSSLDARLSFTNIDYQYNTGNNFRGVNGALGWNWQPTGKTQTRLSFVSTPGSGINNLQVNNSKFSRTVNLSATYLATGKTSFNANIGVTQDEFSRPPVANLPESANDLYTTLGLGVNYAPSRNSKLACNLAYQRRNAGDAAFTFGYYPYHGAHFNCSGQLLLQ
jgi:hypothetical protein